MILRRVALLLAALPLVAGADGPAEAGAWFRPQITPPDFVFSFLPKVRMPGQPTVALALSGGGSRGLAHVGVLQRLEAGGYDVDAIAGTSAGALTGALWGAGFSGRDIEALFRRLDLSRAFLDPLLRKPGESLSEQEWRSSGLLGFEVRDGRISFAQGLQGGAEVQRTLEALLTRATYFSEGSFDRLRVPVRILATNLETGHGHAFGKGSLVKVLQASMAVPGAFTPVELEGEQYVDGAFTENIPVLQARAAFQPSVVLAVDVSSPYLRGRASNFFSITAKSLDLMVERQQRESRTAANLVLRPDIPEAPFLDYQAQLSPLVAAGRQAFDRSEAAWEGVLDGAWATPPGQPATTFTFEGSTSEGTRELAARLLPPGRPITHPAALRLLQQLVSRGLVQDAEGRFEGGMLRVRTVPHPVLGALSLDVPAELSAHLTAPAQALFRPGAPYDPVAFGAFLGGWVNARTLEGAPLADVRGSGFDPATGVLTLRVREPRVRDLVVDPPDRGRLDPRTLRGLFMDLLDRPLRPGELRARVEVARHRFQLADLTLDLRPHGEDGVAVRLTPVSRHLASADLILGYESTLGGLLGFRAKASNLGLRGLEAEASGARNRLQSQGGLALRAPLPGKASATLEVEGEFFQQRVETPLLFPAPELVGDGVGSRVGASNLRLQAAFHFAHLDRGRAVLGVERRDGVTHAPDGLRMGSRAEATFLSAEWDNLDRHTLPREGLLVRLRAARGHRLAGPQAQASFDEGYLRVRGLQPLNARLGVDLDVEGGLGRGLPLDRWWSLGGPSFLLGTPALGFLAPNFLAVRLGLPIRLQGPLGTTLELAPRLDHGWVAPTPGGLGSSEGAQGRSAGLMLKTTFARYYVELAYGFFSQRRLGGAWSDASGTFNVRVGLQPFDLWRRR